jgi:hypothetical protein
MDGLAVISRGLASGQISGGEPYPVEDLNIDIQIVEEENISIAVNAEIAMAVEVE